MPPALSAAQHRRIIAGHRPKSAPVAEEQDPDARNREQRHRYTPTVPPRGALVAEALVLHAPLGPLCGTWPTGTRRVTRQHVIAPVCWDDFGTVERYDDVTVPGPCNPVARPALCVREVGDRRSPDEYCDASVEENLRLMKTLAADWCGLNAG